jgi:hypothetical protein
MAKSKKFTNDERTFAILTHLSALVIGFIGPLIFYLLKSDGSEYMRDNARHALNFQVSLIIYMVISVILCFVLVGFLMIALFALLNLVAIIIATIKASEGKAYRYPLEIEFVK